METNDATKTPPPTMTTHAESINKSFISSINAALARDPEANLLTIIQTYERRRSKLELQQADKSASSQRALIDEKQRKEAAEAREKELFSRRILPRLNSSLTIECPISPRLSNLLEYDEKLLNPSHMLEKLSSIIQNGKVIWYLVQTAVIDIGQGVVVKTYPGKDNTEASILGYLYARHEAVPTPELHGLMYVGNRSYLFMSRVKGVSLKSLWPSLGVAQKLSIQQQLDPIFAQLRAIPWPDGTALGSGVPPRCKDRRRYDRVSDKALFNEAEFNEFLVPAVGRRLSTSFSTFLHSILPCDHRTVLTHGDLHPRNIMVEENGGHVNVTGIIDWESTGWYPEYWEYVKALDTVSRFEEDDWCFYLPDSIGCYPLEFAKDCILDRILS